MYKNKFLIMLLGLLLTLSGCSSTVDHKKSNTGDTATKQSNQQTNTSSNAASNNSTDTSTKTGNTKPNVPSAVPQSNTINIGTITAVRLADFNIGWVGGKGSIAKTTDGGKNWTVIYKGSGTVQQIYALNQSEVWAVLNQGENSTKLLQSINGGKNWSPVGNIPNHSFLHFTSKSTALSGNYLSQDGGKTWHSLTAPINMVGDAYFHDVKNGWAVTQSNNAFAVKRTTDGGTTWGTVMEKSSESSLHGAVIRSAGINDAWVELIGDSGMSQTSYSVFHTIDGGKSWTTVIANSTAGAGPAPGFGFNENTGPNNKGSKPGPLYVVNTQTAFMGGVCPACDIQNSIGWTKNGGKTWVNSKVTLEGSGESLLAVSDSNHAWWITTEYEKQSELYTTTDGGIHWNRVYIFH